ncbi:hypothetical protein [Methylocella sp.]|uniref:hypothetical protein n=1 Tax=Methylocella sp. TaxID=1978226 RepID=UPI003784DEF7
MTRAPLKALPLLAVFAMATFAGAARAADYSAAPGAPQEGVPCSIGQPFWEPSKATAQELAERDGWPAVYYGHFSGGRPYQDASGQNLVDWRDEHMCFPSSRQCQDWVRSSHASHHDPEGWRGCLLLR